VAVVDIRNVLLFVGLSTGVKRETCTAATLLHISTLLRNLGEGQIENISKLVSKYADYYRQECDAIQSGRSVTNFQRNIYTALRQVGL
jgi:hypothetical protein